MCSVMTVNTHSCSHAFISAVTLTLEHVFFTVLNCLNVFFFTYAVLFHGVAANSVTRIIYKCVLLFCLPWILIHSFFCHVKYWHYFSTGTHCTDAPSLSPSVAILVALSQYWSSCYPLLQYAKQHHMPAKAILCHTVPWCLDFASPL